MTKVEGVEVRDEFVVLGGNTTVEDAAKTCEEQDVKYIVVVEDDEIAGVVTAADFMYRVVAEGRPPTTLLKDIMSRPPVLCHMDDDINDVADVMWKMGYSALPVIGPNGSVEGVLTVRDIIYEFAKQHMNESEKEVVSKLMRFGIWPAQPSDV